MPSPTVRGWRVDAAVAQLVKDYAAVRNLTLGAAATQLLRRALEIEQAADPSLTAAMQRMRDARPK